MSRSTNGWDKGAEGTVLISATSSYARPPKPTSLKDIPIVVEATKEVEQQAKTETERLISSYECYRGPNRVDGTKTEAGKDKLRKIVVRKKGGTKIGFELLMIEIVIKKKRTSH
jgi:hypothetical protein